ncbi:hypothetical protein HG531_002474 [Fusarium graminearum]|nr:hypothetical protein HG531_002474 [Fusarium graminearum]
MWALVWLFFSSVVFLSVVSSTFDTALMMGALIRIVLLWNDALNVNLSPGLTDLLAGSFSRTRDLGATAMAVSVRMRSWFEISLKRSMTTMAKVGTLISYLRSRDRGPDFPAMAGKVHLISELPVVPIQIDGLSTVSNAADVITVAGSKLRGRDQISEHAFEFAGELLSKLLLHPRDDLLLNIMAFGLAMK